MALTPESAVRLTNKLYKELAPRAEEAIELMEFYEGKQPLVYASNEWAESHKAKYKDFSDNWCETVANAPVERESMLGFRLPSSRTAKQSRTEKALWDAWLRNEQDSLSVQGFLSATIARRSFCQVWGDPDGEPIITWKAANQAIVAYDAETGLKRVASLVVWDDEDDGFEYGTLQTPAEVWPMRRARLYKAAHGAGFVLPTVFADGGGWEQVPGKEPGVNHLGKVSVVELPNRPVLGRGPLSDIKGTVAMQNAINLLWAYLFNAADSASMPARVVMGQEPPKIPVLDSDGQPTGQFKPVDAKSLTNGRMLWLTGQNTSIDKWDAANLEVFTKVIERSVAHIAAQTRTPHHYLLSGNGVSNLSAEAMLGLEAGLVQKVEQAQDFFNPRLRDVFELIALQLGEDKAAKESRLGEVVWKNANNRSDAQVSDAMVKDKQAGYPFEYLLEKRGHSPQEIKRIMKMREAEMTDPMIMAAIAAGDSNDSSVVV